MTDELTAEELSAQQFAELQSLKSLHLEVIAATTGDLAEMCGIDPGDALSVCVAVMRSDWLADRLAVARAEALTEAADAFRAEGRDVMFNKAGDDLSPQGRVAKWLRDRAAIARGNPDTEQQL